MADLGLRGVEVYTYKHSPKEVAALEAKLKNRLTALLESQHAELEDPAEVSLERLEGQAKARHAGAQQNSLVRLGEIRAQGEKESK